MNIQFAVAGALALTGASVHGILGERIVVMKLRTETLPSSQFGSPSFTKVMIRATWHITTLAFLILGTALIGCAPDGSSRACDAVGRISSIAFASFFALTTGLAIPTVKRARLRHPAPLVFAAVAALSWWGGGR